MAEFVTNKRILVMKAESTPGTAVALASADFDLRARASEFSFEIAKDQDDAKFGTGDHGHDEGVPGIKSAAITTECKVAPSPTIATVEPRWFKLAKACGHAVVDYTTVGMGLQPTAASDNSTATIAVYDIARGATPAAIGQTMAGAMGTLVISASDVGAPIVAKASFKGKFSGFADVANGSIPALTAPDTSLAIPFVGGSCVIDSITMKAQSFELDTGSTVEWVKDLADATGIVYACVTKRTPKFKVTVLRDTLSAFNPKVKDESTDLGTVVLTCGQFGITVPNAQLVSTSIVDISGTVGYELTYNCLRNGSAVAALPAEVAYEILHGART